jgi:hypothetical protein
MILPISVKVLVCGCFLAGIAGLNSVGGMGVYIL